MSEPEVRQGSGEQYDNPNQEVVRGDESGPADEGEGGTERVDPEPLSEGVTEAPAASESPSSEELDAMSKDELLELARSRGISPANAAMSKDELRRAVERG